MRIGTRNTKWQRIPLIIIVAYIIFSLFLSLSGMIVFRDYKWWISTLYMLVVIGAIIYGYNQHTFSTIHSTNKTDYLKASVSTVRFVKICIIITIAVYFLAIIQGLITRGISINVILDRIIHTSDAYKDETVYEMGFINYLISFTGIFKLIAICGLVLFWGRLRRFRVYGIIAVGLDVINNMVFVGSMKELGDIIVFLSISYVIKRDKSKPINKPLLITITVIAIALFSFILYTRTLGYEYGLSRTVDKYYFRFNTNNLFYKCLSPSIAYSLTLLFSYISQGYYGLSLSLQSPFTFTWGIGNSFTFSAYFNSFFGVDLRESTYPFLAERLFGYPALESWSSIFPWIASDYTWVGAVIIMGFVSRLYASLWDECKNNNLLLPPIFFAQLTIMWIYLPCNNQLMQTLQSTITTIILFLAYFCKRRNINFVFGDNELL